MQSAQQTEKLGLISKSKNLSFQLYKVEQLISGTNSRFPQQLIFYSKLSVAQRSFP
jgi:hypothetical protein